MRLIFYTLILANILLGMWVVLSGDDDKEGAVKSVSVSGKKLHEPISSREEFSRAAGGLKNINSALCDLVGPFAENGDAGIFVERLNSIGIPSTVETVEFPAGQSYWVHVPPLDSYEAAFRKLSDFQARGVESYVIGKGELKNAVSLGVFTYIDLAKNRQKQLRKSGIDVEIKSVPRTRSEIWVMIQPKDGEKMSSRTWERMLEGLSSQERRQNFCLSVASSDNFQ